MESGSLETAAEIRQEPTPKKSWLIYPVLLSVYPVLSLYSANLSLIPVQNLVRPMIVIILLTAVVWGVLRLITRRTESSAIATSILMGSVLAHTRIADFLGKQDIPPEYRLGTWVGLTVIAMVVLGKFWRWHRLLNFLSVALMSVTSAQIIFGLINASRPTIHQIAEAGTTATIAKRPDIIYIILDGYGRSDALKRALNYNNDSFIRGLEDRGFYVAKDSKSNYSQTELSVGSSLNMEFIPELLPDVNKESNNRVVLDTAIDKNAVAQYLRNRGYSFGAITTDFPPLRFPSADINYRTRQGYSLIETALIQMTPLVIMPRAYESMFAIKRLNILSAFEELESLKTKSAKPRFVVVHIIAPHPPFVFDAKGKDITEAGVYGYWDGSDYMDHVGTPDSYRKGYSEQAEYIGNRLLQSLDHLLSGPGEKPIILVQGDHGSKLRLDQGFYERTDVNECFPNLSAYLVPDSVKTKLYPGVTPVNSFRLLFNGLFDAKFELKPDRSWYSNYPQPYKFIEVTDKIANHDKMASVPVPDFGPRPKP